MSEQYHDEQAGLQVHAVHDPLEAVQPNNSHYISPFHEDGKEVYVSSYADEAYKSFPGQQHNIQLVYAGQDYEALPGPQYKAALPPHRSPWYRRRWVWITVTVAVLLMVIAGVVGGVLGSRKSQDSHALEPPIANDTAPTTIVRSGSRLATTGWRLGGTSNVRLFWQAKNNSIYYSGWDTKASAWNAPVKVAVDHVDNTSMVAGVVFQSGAQEGAPADPQVQFFYQNTTGYLQGYNFRASFPDGLPDSIDNAGYSFPMSNSSRLSSYWPIVAYQSPRSVQVAVYSYGNKHSGYASLPDPLRSSSNNVAIVGRSSGEMSLAVLPLQVQPPLANQTTGIDVKVLYKRSDGLVYEYDQYLNGTIGKDNEIPGVKVEKNATLAAFATAAPQDSSTIYWYIVYQASDGTLQYGIKKSSTGSWEGPKVDPVLGSADSGTDIACVTAATDPDWQIYLTGATDLNRCFFQRKGRLVQVLLDGDAWRAAGSVDVP